VKYPRTGLYRLRIRWLVWWQSANWLNSALLPFRNPGLYRIVRACRAAAARGETILDA
jgi:tetraacyldisaccharide-1-P 4'-kinase